jgi:sporulation protein YlmC with PRC-barrel domain
MRKTLIGTSSALALLLGTAALVNDVPAAEQELAETDQPIDGEDLVEDPTHGMGEGDDAIGGGVSTHGLEGERGYADLDAEERESVRVEDEQHGWTLDELLGASVADGNGEAIGGIEDLIVNEDDQIRKVVLKITADGDGERFVLVELDGLQPAEDDAGDPLVFAGDLEGDDHQRVERQDERWLPIDD